MQILLVQPLRYLLTGGAHKANRMLLRGLAARGHACRAIAVMGGDADVSDGVAFAEALRAQGHAIVASSADEVTFRDGDVEVHAVRTIVGLGARLAELLRAGWPSHVIVSEDSTLLLVDDALRASAARVVYLCHSQSTLPFGPASFVAAAGDPAGELDVLRRADGVLTVSHYVRRYLAAHAGVDSTVLYFPSYGAGPFPDLAGRGRYVTLINPSAVKGLPIFLGLARARPDVAFAAVPTWGTTAADRAALAALPNVTLLAPVADVDQLYAQTQVLLAPSLWGESFGQVVVEAMLRGVPVIAADAGGLPEAKLGVEYLVPVRPIERYAAATDERSIPIPVVPEQDLAPWLRALDALVGDPDHHRDVAARSRAAAHAFVGGLSYAAFERYLAELPAPARGGAVAAARARQAAHRALTQGLSPERRALLAARLAADGARRAGAPTSADGRGPRDETDDQRGTRGPSGRNGRSGMRGDNGVDGVSETRDATGAGRASERRDAQAPAEPIAEASPGEHAASGPAQLSSDKRALLALRLKRRQRPTTDLIHAVPAAERPDALPLSYSQRLLWLEHELTPDSLAYHVAAAYRVRGALDLPALQAALDAIVARHEALRTVFVAVDGEPVQRVLARCAVPIEVEHLPDEGDRAEGDRAEGDRAEVAAARTRALARAPYDLTRGPLLRARLYVLGPGDHQLALAMHHIICDGWSVGVFFRELIELYAAAREGRAAALAPLPIQYADYALWQRRWLAEAQDRHLAWWRGLLGERPIAFELPTDRARLPDHEPRGEKLALAFPPSLAQQLVAFSRAEGATLFMTLLAGFVAVLHRYTGQREITVGTTVANRPRVQLEGLIGYFVNTLALKTDLGEEELGFRALVGRVREMTLGAYEHQELPFDALVRALRLERRARRNPLFEVTFGLQNTPMPRVELPGLSLESVATDVGGTVFDLSLQLWHDEDRLHGYFEFDAALFERATIERLGRHLAALLAGAVAEPDRPLRSHVLLDAAERALVIDGLNRTERALPSTRCVHDQLSDRARAQPDAVAAVCGAAAWTYGELDAASDGVAGALAAQGVAPGEVVALYADRGLAFLAAVLGIFKVGAVYMPVDPAYPAARVRTVLGLARARCVLASAARAAALREDLGAGAIDVVALEPALDARLPYVRCGRPDAVAYVLFTSGSTGEPKGAMVAHDGMLNHLYAKTFDLGLTAADAIAQNAPQSFVVSIWQLLVAFVVGGRVHVYPEDVAQDPIGLLDAVARDGVTILEIVPSMQRMMLEAHGDAAPRGLAGLRWLVITGEALPPELARRWLTRYPHPPLLNAYGQTECSDDVAHHALHAPPPRELAVTPIGRPVANLRLYVLDRAGAPAPLGVAGELHVGGVGVGRGYLGRADLTAQVFVPDPFAAAPGARMYRTGDLARWRPDLAGGAPVLEYLGRVDFQVKIRGVRIELGEIEAVIARHPAVTDVVVAVREDQADVQKLVAYVVASGGAAATSELRAHVRAHLPEYMAPSAWVRLDALPRNANGKTDRKALRAIAIAADGEPGAAGALRTPPRTAVERELAQVWAAVLERPEVGVEDNFFELGGDSILTVRIAARARAAGLAVLPRMLFQHQTIAALAAALPADDLGAAAAAPASPTSTPRAAWPVSSATAELLARRAADMPGNAGPAPIEAIFPLTVMQHGMLYYTLLLSRPGIYVEQLTCTLDPALDVAAFQAAWRAVTERHGALRSFFVWEGVTEPVQVVCRAAEAPWSIEDLVELSVADAQARLAADIDCAWDVGLPLGEAPLQRFYLQRWRDGRFHFRWAAHHILMDGWSSARVLAEVAAAYEALRAGRAPALPPAPRWQDYLDWLARRAPAATEAFWRAQLAGFTGNAPLVPERAQLTAQRHHYQIQYFDLGASTTEALASEARRHRVTMNTLVQAAWAQVLGTFLGERDLVIGATFSGRPAELAGVEGLVGLLINTVPLRIQLEPDAELGDWLRRLFASQLAMEDHVHASLADIQRFAGLEPGRPLFESLLVFENYPIDRALTEHGGGSLGAADVRGFQQTNYPLTVFAVPGESLALGLSFDTGRFTDAFIERLLARLRVVLEAIALASPRRCGELAACTAREREQLAAWNPPVAAAAPTFAAAFCAQVAARPEAIAVTLGAQAWSYAELAARAGQIAQVLRRAALPPGALIGLCADASIDRIAAVLAIVQAGHAWLPLDPAYPAERLRLLCADSGAALVMVHDRHRARFALAGAPCCSLDEAAAGPRAATPSGWHAAAPDERAYVIYTSGSTGLPKGVELTHGGLANLIAAQAAGFGVTGESRVLQFSSPSFDASVSEIAVTLGAGATLCLAADDERVPGPALVALLERQRVTHVTLPPSVLGALPPAALPSLHTLIVAGEPCSAELVARWATAGRRVINAYGPTEATVCATLGVCAPDGKVPTIGRPMSGVQVHVLDDRMQPVPIGAPGEIYLGGAGVARGYLGRDELTRAAFVPDPSAHPSGAGRLYRTGDRARYLADGTLEFLGRIDRQLKIRGFRVEPGEIEHRLEAIGAVAQAAVVPELDGDAARLVAYVVPASHRAPELWPSVAEFYVYDELLYHAMTHDHRRNQAYEAAIRAAVPGKIVVDIGTGQDAILACLCARAGARRVYAIDRSATACAAARRRVAALGLGDLIQVIHGDATTISLPEPADVSVSEIVGSIGGAEGAARIINETRHLLGPGAQVIPARSVTRIAAVALPELLRGEPAFTEVSAHYVRQIFAQVGARFDLRLCVKNLPHDHVLSSSAPLEDLDYTRPVPLEADHTVELAIARDGSMDGFVVWLTLDTGGGELIDTLAHEHCWLPVFVPMFEPAIAVRAGDVIELAIARRLCANGLNPDFHLAGQLRRADGTTLPIAGAIYHQAPTFGVGPYHARLFAEGDVPVRAARDASAPTGLAEALRAALAGALPSHLVPARFVVVDDLPRTPAGKLDRRALADRAVAAPARAIAPPRTALERLLIEIWSELLGASPIGVDDDFFALGGHSLLAVRLLARIADHLDARLSLASVLEHPTVAGLAALIEGRDAAADARPAPATIVALRSTGRRAPLCCVPGAGGLPLYLQPLARALSADQPVLAVQARGLDGEGPPHATIEAMAEAYVDALIARQPTGPYRLAGHSLGGLVAYEMGRQLLARGRAVELVVLLDIMAPAADVARLGDGWDHAQWVAFLARTVSELIGQPIELPLAALRAHDEDGQIGALAGALDRAGLPLAAPRLAALLALLRVHQGVRYEPVGACALPLVVVRARELQLDGPDDPATVRRRAQASYGWDAYTTLPVAVLEVAGNHLTMLAEPAVRGLAAAIEPWLARPGVLPQLAAITPPAPAVLAPPPACAEPIAQPGTPT